MDTGTPNTADPTPPLTPATPRRGRARPAAPVDPASAARAQARAQARAWTREQTRLGRRTAAPVIAAGLASTLLAIAQAFCIARVLDLALAGGTLPMDQAAALSLQAAPWLAGFAGLALCRALLLLASERAAFAAGAAARRRLRTDALSRLLQAGPSLLRLRPSGELTAAVVDRIEALDGLFSRWVPAATLALLAPTAVAIAALLADPFAALVLICAGLLVPVAMALSGIGAAAASKRQFLALARLQARFLDRVRGIATIVLAGRTEDEARALATAADELRQRTMRVLRVAFLSSAALDCALAAALVILALHDGHALLAATATNARALTPATALFCLLLAPEFFAPLRAFSLAYQDRLQAAGAAEVLASLPPPATVPDGPAPEIRNVAARGVAVAFDDVRLSWDPARAPALDGMSFRVPAGETLVLAGPSGAGKSTVIEVLLGFARPDSGRVLLNGAAIETIVPSALAKLTAWIGQKPVLFAGTLRENIAFGRPDATSPEIEQAAARAQVDAFAAGLPLGLDTVIGEGGHGLSGGQAQRVAIARAFLRNAPLLLLDEPTAHLDPATEAEVLESLRRLAVGRTVILASHSAAAHGFGGRRLDIRDGRAAGVRGAA
ncbi:MAG: thiol reductant ABC exporter subunit CydD [Janthinobacterium lividum]